MVQFGFLLGGIVVGLAIGFVVAWRRQGGLPWGMGRRQTHPQVARLIQVHFHPIPFTRITITERSFPFRVRADLQRGIDRLFGSDTRIEHFTRKVLCKTGHGYQV